MRRERHTITLEDFENFTANAPIASSAGRGSHKQVGVKVNVGDVLAATYIVISHEKVVYEGQNLSEAINAYNQEP